MRMVHHDYKLGMSRVGGYQPLEPHEVGQPVKITRGSCVGSAHLYTPQKLQVSARDTVYIPHSLLHIFL